MKNKIILMSLLNAVIWANNLPINLNLGFSSSYNRYNISKNDFKNYGFENLKKENYSKHSMVNSLNIDATYNIKLEHFDVNVGLGANLFFENKFDKPITIEEKDADKEKEIEIALYNLNEKNDEILKVNAEIENLSYPKLISKNRYLTLEKRVKHLNTANTAANTRIAKIEAKMAEVPQSDIPTLEARFLELETTVDSNRKIEDNFETAIKYSEFVLKFLPDTTENAAVREQHRTNIENYKQKRDEARQKRVEAMAERLRIIDTLDLIKLGDEQIANKRKEIEANNLKIADANAQITPYKERENELKAEERTVRNTLSEKESDLEKMTDKYRVDILGDESAYNSVDDYYEFPEDEKPITERLKVALNNLVSERENSYASAMLENKLASSYNFGGGIYSIVGIQKEVAKDLKVFSNLTLGVTLSQDPLYKIATELENEKVKIDGKEYIRPRHLKNIKANVKTDISLGLKYKGFRSEIFAGYGNGIVGLKLGYEF